MDERDRVAVWVEERSPGERGRPRLCWHDPATGRVRRKSAGGADPGAVERARADLEYELTNGLYRAPGKMAWDEMRRLYESEKVIGQRDSSKGSLTARLDRFEADQRPRYAADLNTRSVARHAAGLRAAGYRAVTVHGHLTNLRAFARWAHRQKFLPELPLFEMPKLPKKRRIRTTDAAGLARLLTACPSAGWECLCLLGWHAGLRRAELVAVRWDRGPWPWLDLEAKRIHLPAEWCKSDADDWLPISAPLLAELEARRQKDGPVFPCATTLPEVSRKFIEKVARVAGVGVSLHDLRRSFGTRLAPHVPPQVLMRLMRHQNISTTMKYYADLDGGLDAMVNRGYDTPPHPPRPGGPDRCECPACGHKFHLHQDVASSTRGGT